MQPRNVDSEMKRIVTSSGIGRFPSWQPDLLQQLRHAVIIAQRVENIIHAQINDLVVVLGHRALQLLEGRVPVTQRGMNYRR
jgi:choline kinase